MGILTSRKMWAGPPTFTVTDTAVSLCGRLRGLIVSNLVLGFLVLVLAGLILGLRFSSVFSWQQPHLKHAFQSSVWNHSTSLCIHSRAFFYTLDYDHLHNPRYKPRFAQCEFSAYYFVLFYFICYLLFIIYVLSIYVIRMYLPTNLKFPNL